MKRFVQLRRADGQALPRLVESNGPIGIDVAEMETKSSAMKRLLVTLRPGLVQEDVKDGKLQLWLEDEAEPLTWES